MWAFIDLRLGLSLAKAIAMKSQVNALLHVMHGLILDVRAAYPALRGLDLDLENLTLQSRTRGLKSFTLDLPNLDSLLVQGLKTGRLSLSGPFSRRVSRRVRVPRLFSGLWLRVFDSDACLRPDADVNSIFFLRCLTTLGKKLEVGCSSSRILATVRTYHDIERRLRQPTLEWAADRLNFGKGLNCIHLGECIDSPGEVPLFDHLSSLEEVDKEKEIIRHRNLLRRCQQVADILVNTFDSFEIESFTDDLYQNSQGIGFRHGPGAVAEKMKNWDKSRFPSWPNKLEGTFPFSLCGTFSMSGDERPINHEVASRLLCVPKTSKSPRLIAAEPVAHMWCQQALLSWFDSQFKKHFGSDFIDLHDQSKSGSMVLQASLSGSHATVDLSDASDRITCWTVERIFRCKPSILKALHAARTRYLQDCTPVSDGSFIKLKKFASQGTATTFPVMSFVILCLALGSSIRGRVTIAKVRKLRSQVRVFGDDVILPTHGYADLCLAMTLCQMKVNEAKSFDVGHFRESCGTDGYLGFDITPIRPKSIVPDGPTSCQAVVDTSNNAFKKGLWNASYSLLSLLPPHIQRGLRVVGINEVGFSGLVSFCGSDERHLKKRWNHGLHRYDVRTWSNRTRVARRDREGSHVLLDFFASKYNSERPRTVSEYGGTWKSLSGLLWEPSNSSMFSHTSCPNSWVPRPSDQDDQRPKLLRAL